MYDIKTIEFGQQKQQQQQQHQRTTLKTQQYEQPKHKTATSAQTDKWPYTISHYITTLPLPSTLSSPPSSVDTSYSTCSVITPAKHISNSEHTLSATDSNNTTSTTLQCYRNPAETTHMTLLSLRRRRLFQRHACLLSILAAFIFGLVLGVFMPMFGLANVLSTLTPTVRATANTASIGSTTTTGVDSMPSMLSDVAALPLTGTGVLTANRNRSLAARPPSDFPTIYELRAQMDASAASTASAKSADNPFSVAFIKEHDVDVPADEIFRNAFHLAEDKSSPGAMIVKKFDTDDGSIREFRIQRIAEGRFRKGPEHRVAKSSYAAEKLAAAAAAAEEEPSQYVPREKRIVEKVRRNQRDHDIIKSDIYWGDIVEAALPKGFTAQDTADWNQYVSTLGVVEHLEPGCGRMQNRLVVFADGTRACARYRQNTDQIQGELFSYYLGQLLNMSNLAPSAAAVIDLESHTWSSAIADITQSQWRQQRPVVLTRWLADLEPAGIPQPFQPLERHLNKYDVWNITLGATNSNALMSMEKQKGLLKRLEAATSTTYGHQSNRLEPSSSSISSSGGSGSNSKSSVVGSFSSSSSSSTSSALSPLVLQRLIELAQWSDLIVFDYLIANLDRVVNNLYNYQWNVDIMAAPAHNLARQINTQLLVFLDNESGLLHGYRLLKKYEAYHGLLLDNLCVFRQPTIEALQQLRTYGAGHKLRELFEKTTSAEVRDVLPSLPDKSIKILVDRIDRVLGQVQKCKDLLADR